MEPMKQIIQTLETMIQTHKQVVELAKEKKVVLIAGEMDELKRLLQRENTFVDQILQLEQQRVQAVESYMSEQRSSKADSFTLEDVLTLERRPNVKAALHSLAKELRSLVEEISTLNQTNQQLIESSLSYVQYSIGMLVPREPSIGYGPNRGNRYSSLLDAKI